jgi:hypothetical protein
VVVAHELDVEVHDVPGVLAEQAGQARARDDRHALPVDPRGAHPRIVGARQADDERPALRRDRLEVGHARIAPVGQQQPVPQRRGGREKRALDLRVGRHRHGAGLVGEATVRGVDFDGRRFDRREPPWERVGQGRLDREGRPVLNHQVREAGDGAVSLRRERLHPQLVQEAPQHLLHETSRTLRARGGCRTLCRPPRRHSDN